MGGNILALKVKDFFKSSHELLMLVPGTVLILAFSLPLYMVIYRSISHGMDFASVMQSAYYRNLIVFTFRQAVLSTLFSILFGLPGAYLVGRCRFPGRRLLKSLSTVPFVLPPVLAVLGFVLVFGNAGIINRFRMNVLGLPPWKILYSLPAIVMAHVFYNFPLTLRIVGDTWSRLPALERLAAQSLGASAPRAFFSVDLPRLLPSIITAAILTFLYCFMSFSIVLVLGGGPALSTVEVEIYRLVKHQLNFARGSALASAESLILFLLLGVYALADNWLRGRTGDDVRSLKIRDSKVLSGIGLWLGLLYLAASIIFIMAPLVSIVIQSFIARATKAGPPVFSLSHWMRLLGRGGRAQGVPLYSVIRTLGLGFIVAAGTTLSASATAWYAAHHLRMKKIIDTFMAIPLGVSSLIIGLGWLILLQSFPAGKGSRYMIMAAAHSLASLPFCYRMVAGRLKQISLRVPQAARAAGASAFKTFLLVEIPMARSVLISSAVFAFAISAGELNATIILAPGNFTTIPLAIYRLIGAYDFQGACALGTLLIMVCTLAFFVLDHYSEDTNASH